MKTLALPELGVIRVAGDDRTAFLQGQLTQDLAEVKTTQGRLWGWNNPKGRLLATGQAIDVGESTLLVLRAELLATVTARLRMFVLRAKVSIETTALDVIGIETGAENLQLGGLELGANRDATATDGARCLARVIGDPGRVLGINISPDREREAGSADAWQLADVRAGLPVITPATSESFVPQMVNLDLLGGISFTKGCYVGQEVVARTQNLGRIKRRMFRYASAAPAKPGDSVVNGAGDKAGTVVRCAVAGEGHELLAVAQLTALGGPLFVSGAPLEALPLPYAIPETA